jgi:hypothetical protein
MREINTNCKERKGEQEPLPRRVLRKRRLEFKETQAAMDMRCLDELDTSSHIKDSTLVLHSLMGKSRP